jgi:glycosyltransferase involved in cell wall biosynthesis
MCLDYANEKALEASRKIGFRLYENVHVFPKLIEEHIEKADIVLIHFWNHPLLYDFLVRETLPPARIIMWSHISGSYPPYVFTRPLLRYPDYFVFTTPLSFGTKEVQALESTARMPVIWSTAGPVSHVQPRPHKGFVVGYIGTVDYCKLHPDFLKMCAAINIPDVHFVVCGGPCENEIRKEAESMGIGDKFTFTGYVDNVADYLAGFDVFGYPLNPMHYGTCDQALTEAMAAGVPPVVLSNPMESHMVQSDTGLVVQDADIYVKTMEYLYLNPASLKPLSENARASVGARFSLDKMIGEWKGQFDEAMSLTKTAREWMGRVKGENVLPSDVFLESLGEYGKDFDPITTKNLRNLREQPIWSSATRGTAHHYHYFSPEDERLKLWSDLT